jgi:phage-related protein
VVRIKLGGRNLTKLRFPPDRYWATQCPYARGFKSDPRCGYTGALTTCSGSLDDCIARSNQTRWGGFLGGDEKAARLVIPYAMRRS